ncbi:MAG: efflux RND transporter periplasmic adaptor subunit [Chthoniobacterales bacterium]|nr:efflux RND transporter periplasmic adaptor subunit [Chthoniobacterales bacterium]
MQTVTAKTSERATRSSVSPAPRRSQKGPIFWVILGLVLIFLAFAGLKALQIITMITAGKAMVPPPTTVTSATVKQADWQPTISAIGSISPVQGATISAELAGRVSEIDFESGAKVKQGEPLLKLDTAAEVAQLRSAQADAELMKSELDRSSNLAKGNVISKSEFDTARSKYDAAKAAVDNMQATINKKEIRAPFAGVAGIRYVNPGQMVAVGDKLVSLQTLDQVFVDFSLPQNDLPKVSVGLEVKVTTDALPGREFKGSLSAINPAIDAATRSVQVQASLENKDHALRPGMFAKVEVLLPQKISTLYIPATAVAYAPFGDSIYVIEKKQDKETKKEGLVLRQQFIRLGETRGDFVAVTEGLKKGQEIVSTGAFKLRNGMGVVVDNKLAPKPQLAPTPDNT